MRSFSKVTDLRCERERESEPGGPECVAVQILDTGEDATLPSHPIDTHTQNDLILCEIVLFVKNR